MIGDGFTVITHCENAEYETYFDKTPDDLPVECKPDEENDDQLWPLNKMTNACLSLTRS